MPGEFSKNEYLEDKGTCRFVTTHLVDDSHHGWRVDLYIKEKLKRRSRNYIQNAIDEGIIKLTHREVGELPRLKPSTVLQAGDEVQVITFKTGREPEVDFGYKILFEDDCLLIVDKPGNIPVHPAGRYFFNTLLNKIRTDRFEKFKSGEEHYHLVHRIDRETSGILLIAKNTEIAPNLVSQFRFHKVEKRYLAITKGVAEKDSFSVDVPITNDVESSIRLKKATTPIPGEGLPSFTHFEVLKRSKNFSLIEAHPKTGRQHQIRVHLASVGLPIVGDKLYSGFDHLFFDYLKLGIITDEMREKLFLPRHALHATYLKFTHPITGKTIEINCPMPEDLMAFLEKDSL